MSEIPSQPEILEFREQLETKYRTGLGRAPAFSQVNPRDTTLSTLEYLRHWLSGCTREIAEAHVMAQLEGRTPGAPCGNTNHAAVPRDELLAFRGRLDAALSTWPPPAPAETAVDVEGEAVWTQEYVLWRFDGCTPAQAVERVFAQIDGKTGIPPCR